MVSINEGSESSKSTSAQTICRLSILQCHLPIVPKPEGTRLPTIETTRYFRDEHIILSGPE